MGVQIQPQYRENIGTECELVITGCIGQPLLLSPSHYQWTHKQKITKKTDAALTLMKTPASIFTMTTNWATLWTETENLCSPCPLEPTRGRPPVIPKRNPNPYNFKNDLRRPQKGGQGPSGPDGCRSGAKNVAHESQCDLYYECFGDQGFIQTCPNGLMYNGGGAFGLLGPCDYPHNVNCYDREGRNPPQSTEHCDWLYGIFGHETSCTRYWTCWNGTATEQFCIGGLLYNEETHACDWPQNVAGCQKHPLCKDDANGNVPLGKSCNRYWACQGGYPRLQRCPAML